MINIEGYVISPFVFYLISMFNKLFIASIALCVCSIMVIFGALVAEDLKIFKYTLIPLIITAVLIIFIPDKDTCYKMLLAKAITYENINSGKEVVKDSIDYLANKIIEIKEK